MGVIETDFINDRFWKTVPASNHLIVLYGHILYMLYYTIIQHIYYNMTYCDIIQHNIISYNLLYYTILY